MLTRGWQTLTSTWRFAGALQKDQAYRSAKEALAKALELDDSIGEAHDTLGVLSWRFDWDWNAADREFNRAIALAPSYSCAHEDRAIFLALTGRRAEALAEIAKIDQLDYGFSSAMQNRRPIISCGITRPD